MYDSFEGQIDKKGNIIFGSLNINIMFGEEGSSIVSLKGNKDSQFEGAWNDDWDVILKLGNKEQAMEDELADENKSSLMENMPLSLYLPLPI